MGYVCVAALSILYYLMY